MRMGKAVRGNKFMSFMSKLLAAVCLLAAWGAWPAAADEIVRMGIMRFTSKTPNVSPIQAEIITDVFTRFLGNSQSIVVLERERLDMIGREHKLNMSGLVDLGLAVEVGRLAGCQYVLLGSVTQLGKAASATSWGSMRSAEEMAQATVDARIVDVRTSEVVLSLAQIGNSSQSVSGWVSKSFSSVSTGFNDVEERAIVDAVTALSNQIRELLVGEYAEVASVELKNVNINRGATAGVEPNDLYHVYTEGTEIRDKNGRILGHNVITIAVVKVRDVYNEFSIAEVVPSGGKVEHIQRGDKIKPITPEAANVLARRKAFPRDRPRKTLTQRAEESGIAPEDLNEKLGEIWKEQRAQHNDPNAPTSPAPQPTPRPSGGIAARGAAGRALENESTDPTKVVNSYGLEGGKANVLRIAHVNARKLGNNKKAYQKYVELANDYSGDYLAAYRAGAIALQLGDRNNAKAWTDKALIANPNYKPALDLRAQIEKKPGGKKRK